MSLFVTPRDDYKNTWISTNYCNNEPNKWDIWEGMRELLQNQMDGIVSKLKKCSSYPRRRNCQRNTIPI